MKPTVGRIVHFYSSQPADQANSAGNGPYAAIITQVWSDTCVNLVVFGGDGSVKCFTSVTDHLPEDVANMQGRAWQWPPREEVRMEINHAELTEARDAFDKWAEGLGDEAPTGIEGKGTPLVQIPLSDAQAMLAMLKGNAAAITVEMAINLEAAIEDRLGN